VAGVLATWEPVSAGVIQTTINLGTGTATVGASAPVAALTEGVVRSMALFKFKTMAAAVFVACAVGFGALAAAGTGTRDGAGTGSQDQPMQLQGSGGPPVPVSAKPADPPVKPPMPAKPVTDRDRLQGTWRVVSLTEGGKTTLTNPKDPWVIEVSGNTLKMPYLEGGSNSSSSSSTSGSGTATTSGTSGAGWKQREYTFVVDETKVPRTIDLLANQKPLARGIYEFTLRTVQCASCHTNPFDGPGASLPPMLGVCAPVLKDRAKMHDLGVRLALSIDGNRPTKFGGSGVIVFELKRTGPQEAESVRLEEEWARLVEAQKRVADALLAARAAEEKRRLEIELEVLRLQLDELVVREAERKALVELRRAQADLEAARVQAAVAQANVERATLQLKVAKEKVVAAEKALADLKKPQPPGAGGAGGAVFTVHVRTLTAAEKVIRVKATGKETVLEGLVHAADDVPIKSEGVSVWVVRDKTVLPVDLPAILKGDAKTNHTLKTGDQLFVQAKPAK
jgi:uncharacterized protein (TIGR03067 family)